ncbi:polysaccharide lyase family 7 protein [Zhongshania aliphaticivorans]|nr:polysaccharide lyase family 7 protein [Zhongshania aliphaticivorans]
MQKNTPTSKEASTPPSENFDLKQWKITLPVSKNYYFGSDDQSAAEILPGENCNTSHYLGQPLDSGYQDKNYFYSSSKGAMIFKVPLIGGASTISSKYVRSELRELYNWQPCGDDSTANWSSNGSHSLSATLKVVDYYAEDPQTVVGQIHAKNSEKALLKLQWDGPSAALRAIINTDPSHGNPFSIDMGLIPGSKEWRYLITLENNTLTISVTGDEATVSKSVTFGSQGMSGDWRNHVFYFKAGNYVQADKYSGGNFEVHFSNLHISHRS